MMKFCKTDKEIVFSDVKNQFLTVICANLMALSHGGLMGWTSPALLILQTTESQVGKVTDVDTSWLGSITYIGAFFGTLIFMEIIRIFGRKNTFLILAVPNFVFWLIVVWAKEITTLLVFRFFGGLAGGGAYLSIPLLVTEIAEDHVRGILASLLMVFVNIGLLLSYLTGTYMAYAAAPFVMMIFPIAVFVSFLFIPDTPKSLLHREKSDDDIEKSIKFYLNIKDLSTENNTIRLEKALTYVHAYGENKKNKPKVSWKDLTERKALIGFGKSLALVFFSIFCGSAVLNNYASIVFKNSGSPMNPSTSSIIMIVIQVAATVVATSFVDNVGRRKLLILSSIGAAIGLAAFGWYNYVAATGGSLKCYDWVPVVSISFTVFSAYTGLMPLVFVIIMEVIPAKVRDTYATICVSCVSLFMFTIVKIYPLVVSSVHLYSCMWFFASICLCSFFYGLFILEETKGKDINEL